MDVQIFCSSPACWAPGLEGRDSWLSWAGGTAQTERSTAAPSLSFTPPLFRRRLSQLSRMTIQVVHDALTQTGCGDIKQSFISLRGEVARQLSVDRTLISEQTVLPAAFSLSVFNAPIALAAIACGLKSGYSAIFPAGGSFYDGLVTALSPVLGGGADRILLVYGDELIPEEYRTVSPAAAQEEGPLAFACVASAAASDSCRIPVQLSSARGKSPASFLKALIREA